MNEEGHFEYTPRRTPITGPAFLDSSYRTFLQNAVAEYFQPLFFGNNSSVGSNVAQRESIDERNNRMVRLHSGYRDDLGQTQSQGMARPEMYPVTSAAYFGPRMASGLLWNDIARDSSQKTGDHLAVASQDFQVERTLTKLAS